MPRLFTALEVPADIRLRLSLLRGPLPGAHWIDPDNMHLTLRFAGDITEHEANDFAQALDGVSAAALAFDITGVGSFGGKHPTILYADIAPNEALDALQRQHERAARIAGLAAEPRPFKAHVRLARLRQTRVTPVARFLETYGDLRLGPISVERFVLFSARAGTGGGPYAIEETYDLASR